MCELSVKFQLFTSSDDTCIKLWKAEKAGSLSVSWYLTNGLEGI